MEGSWENWTSHLEMEEDNFFINQSQRLNHPSYYDPKEILQQQVLCDHEIDQSHYDPCPSSYSTLHVEVPTTTTNFQPLNPHVQNNPLDKIFMGETTCFHRVNGTDHSCSKDIGVENTLSTHILPNLNMSSIINGSASEGSFERSYQVVNHSLKPARIHPKKVRSSSEIADHIVAERKRRQKLTQNFIALSATIPGLKKTDKSYILQEATNYVHKLQERVRELETENEKINAYSAMLHKKLQLSINNEDSTTCETNFSADQALPEVIARVSEKNVLIAIICEKHSDNIVPRILNLLTSLHLSITSSSIFQFGASTLKITIIAQMEDEYSMTIDDLVKNLRKELQQG